MGGTSLEVFSWASALGYWHRGDDAGAASGPLHHGEGFMGCSSDSSRDDCRLRVRGGSRQPAGLAAVCSLVAITSTTARREGYLLADVTIAALRGGLVLFAVLLVAALASSSEATPREQKADRIVIVKSERTMTLLSGGRVLKTYKVALGGDPVGPKVKVGDKKTPEGEYVIDSKNPKSRFHLALHVSYPNAADRARARKLGVSPGGDVEIHGLESKYAWVGSLHRQVNWTAGCIAVTNPEIEEIYKLVPVGTPVEIRAEEKPTEHTETASKPKQ